MRFGKHFIKTVKCLYYAMLFANLFEKNSEFLCPGPIFLWSSLLVLYGSIAQQQNFFMIHWDRAYVFLQSPGILYDHVQNGYEAFIHKISSYENECLFVLFFNFTLPISLKC